MEETIKGDRELEVVILGSGTGVPLWDRASPSLAVLVDGRPVLFDIGPGTLRQMIRAGFPFEALEHVFLTHFHPDHTADLIGLFFATRNPAIMARKAPFTLHGPLGLESFVRRLQNAYSPWLDLPQPILALDELGPAPLPERHLDRHRILAHPSLHSPNSLAYRIESPDGKVCVYSGDTDFSQPLVSFAAGADLLILESAFPDSRKTPGHLTPSLAGRLAHEARAKRLLLIHFYPECLASDVAAQCRKTFEGELTLASDLLRVRP